MKHPIYRNLTVKDKFFGLDIIDLIIMAVIVNVVFSVSPAHGWTVRILNIAIISLAYLFLSLIKSKFPKGYLTNVVNFLFKERRYLPERDRELKSFYEANHETKKY